MSAQLASTPYPVEPRVDKGELPDVFAGPDGRRITDPRHWPDRAAAWRDQVLDIMYGGMPPAPAGIEVETLCHALARRLRDKPRLMTYRINCLGGARPISMQVQIVHPNAPGPFPAIVNGDGCWWHLSDDTVEQVMDAGCALVRFNRTELAEDLGYTGVPDKHRRAGGLYEVYPGLRFGAIAAWAWGYHRCVDLLQQLSFIDCRRIAVSGHSRGAKTTLVAGATDPRITLINDNASCAAGSALFRYVGAGGETLNIANMFPSWFGPDLPAYVDREEALPFDQHCLLAALAPRPVLLTYALDDRWSNPEGMVQCAWAAREVYRFLGVEDRLAFHLRPGEHRHAPEDWEVLLDFIRWHWQGGQPTASYNQHPYDHLKPAFAWRAPSTL